MTLEANPVEAGEQGKAPARGRARRGDRNRKIILDVALDCFSENGYAGTSTRMIADLSGVAHTLIMYHFESKEKLWIAMMEEVIGGYAHEIHQAFTESMGLSSAERLREYIYKYVGLAARYPQIHRILSQQSTQGSARLDWLIDHHLRKHFESVCELIIQAQFDGAVRKGAPARIYYFITNSGAAPFTVNKSYRALSGMDIFSAAEIHHLIDMICDAVFVPSARTSRSATGRDDD